MSDNDQFAARAVYSSLRRMTDNRTVIQSAFSYWKSELSNQAFDVAKVTTALVDYLDLSSQEKKTLMIALHAASNRLIDELPPVPGMISGDAAQAESGHAQQERKATTQAQSPHVLVTQRYLQLFAQHMRKTDPSEFTDFRQEVASNGLPGVNGSLGTTVTKWAADGMAELKLLGEVSKGDCKQVAHEMYMLATEFIGPNPADSVILNAVNGCLDLDAATRFNPRDLVN